MEPISPKVELLIITRVGDGDNAVTAEVRGVEVRVVEDVEDLRTELQAETLVQWGYP